MGLSSVIWCANLLSAPPLSALLLLVTSKLSTPAMVDPTYTNSVTVALGHLPCQYAAPDYTHMVKRRLGGRNVSGISDGEGIQY